MTDTIAEMSSDELRRMIEVIVEKAVRKELRALLEDADYGLEVREELADRLKRQSEQVRNGERGKPFDEVLEELDL